jgi:hypothetical protein
MRVALVNKLKKSCEPKELDLLAETQRDRRLEYRVSSELVMD